MSRILAYTSPSRGHLFPLVPILDKLRQRGHTIALRTLASEAPLMRARGFDAAPISEKVDAIEMDDWRAGSNPQASLKRAVQVFGARAQHELSDLQRAIAEERPDALLVDVNAWGALSAAELWDGPWGVFCPYPMPLPSSDAPPFGPGFAPARGPLGRLRDSLLRPVVFGMLERTLLHPLNEIRRPLGLTPIPDLDAMFRRFPLILYMTAEPFEYPRRDWPESVVMVGPCAWDPPADPPAWLSQITRPIVLVTTSSEYQDDGRLAQTALDALADEPVAVVATMPSGSLSNYRVPANAHLERFVSHGLALARAVCVVTHGGMGLTQKALAQGVPVCAVPFGRDQHEVARRVEVAGAGTFLPASRLSSDRLRAKIREAMTKGDGAKRIAAAFAATGGADAAAAAFEARILAAQTSQPRIH